MSLSLPKHERKILLLKRLEIASLIPVTPSQVISYALTGADQNSVHNNYCQILSAKTLREISAIQEKEKNVAIKILEETGLFSDFDTNFISLSLTSGDLHQCFKVLLENALLESGV